jgi:hypothetical protein
MALFSHLTSLSQINTGENPPSFSSQPDKLSKAMSNARLITLPKPDLKAVRKQDKIEDLQKEIPWRFGVVLDLIKSPKSDGFWEIDNNQAVWKLSIEIEDAVSLNLNFDKFHLSKNAKLYVYNSNYSDVLGALTAKNNKSDSAFSIRPIKGKKITLELICPLSEKEDNIINTSQIVYGYRSIFDKANKSFGSSGNCNININCPEGDLWQDVKRSIVLILRSNNSRWCSGALINNVEQDSIPYVLTATHCGLDNNSIFVFNYESPQCSPSVDGSLSKSISGATLRANDGGSDFTLFELSSPPPPSYEVYYSGWSALSDKPVKSTGIHHPAGDVMKISHDYDSAQTSTYNNSPTNFHWNIGEWELGTTEVGSSGSPLFDQNHRIVGQLHGGDANCANAINDFYGKFDLSWDNKSGSSDQLKHWLDPNNTGIKIVDGLDSKPSAFNNDVKVLSNNYPTYSCDSNLQPALNFKNNGSDTLQYVRFSIYVNGQFSNHADWSGQLERNRVINLPPSISFFDGANDLVFIVDSIFPGIDQNPQNDTSKATIQLNKAPFKVNVELKTDDYGSEISWEIVEQNKSLTLHKGGPFTDVSGGQVFNRSLCLYDSCFTFMLKDSYGDGFNGQFGSGYLLVTKPNGDTLIFENNFTSGSKNLNFCASGTTGLNKANYDKFDFQVFPNPFKGNSLNIKSRHKVQNVAIFNSQGKRVSLENVNLNSDQIQISNLNLKAGMYLIKVKFKDQKQEETRKLIVTK